MTQDAIGWPELVAGETVLDEASELLWRQVHPQRFQAGMISSDAFAPGSSDAKQLSCSREARVSAEAAYLHYTEELGLQSVGCAAIAVSDIESERPVLDGDPAVAALRAIDDSGVDDGDARPPGHAYVDFRPVGTKKIAKKAKQLAFFARKNGSLHWPPG